MADLIQELVDTMQKLPLFLDPVTHVVELLEVKGLQSKLNMENMNQEKFSPDWT